MIRLEENFICQHFGNICREIRKGTTGQPEWRKYKDKSGKMEYPTWKVAASEDKVLACIRRFFYLCLNASKAGNEYKKIEQWIRDLMIISCMPAESTITDSYKYSKLVEASDPITKFLFGCFDWKITDTNPNPKAKAKEPKQRFLDSFDSRIFYYGQCSYMVGQTAELLYSIKKPRNQETHTAIEEFYTHRQECIERLVFSLYDYITIFYMITNVCREKEHKPINLLEDVCKKIAMPDDFLKTHIVVKCVNEENGEPVPEREADVRLYCVGGKNDRVIVAGNDFPGRFEVTFFKKYVICIVTDGRESEPSEEIAIAHDFIDGIVVKVNIPPKSKTPMPEKISIRELVLNNRDLPADANWILDSIKAYAGDCEYAEVARLLTIAAVTKSENSKKAYDDALEQLKKSIEQKNMDAMSGSSFCGYLQAEMHTFQERLAEPYRDKEDFLRLCECIDNLYSRLDSSGFDDQMANNAQLVKNAKELVAGNRFTYATAAIDESKKQQQQLSQLEFFLKMKEQYPEIVESEGISLYERIEQLYVEQVNFYMGLVIPLRNGVKELYDRLKNSVNRNQPDEEKMLKYAELMDRFLNDTPDNVIRIVQLCGDTMLYWIDQCNSTDEVVCNLRERCKEEIKRLRDNRSLLMSMICVQNDGEKHKIEQAYKIICRCIDNLKEQQGAGISQLKASKDILSEVRFESLVKLMSSCSPESFMQFVCCSLNVKEQIGWLFVCSDLGLSPAGLIDVSGYDKWVRTNRALLGGCLREVDILWKQFSGYERRRQGDKYWSTVTEVNNAEASLIVEHLQQQIKTNYVNNIPQFLQDIMNASDYVLPSHAKAMLLREASVPRNSELECLLYLMNGALRYWGYSSHVARRLLDKYVAGDYGKLIVTEEALAAFEKMSRSSQQLYLEILMEKKLSIAALLPCVRYMMAFNLNFTNGGHGNEVIEQRDFFLKMSQMPECNIDFCNYEEFKYLINVVSLVDQFVSKYPNDEYLRACSEKQKLWFSERCLNFYFAHLEKRSIKEGAWNLSPLYKIGLYLDLKGKPLYEQLLIKYLSLYKLGTAKDYTSGWYHLEEKLFNEILLQMEVMTPEYQQETSRKLIDVLLFQMPYHDIQAERYEALKPFCSQTQFEEIVNKFYTFCKNRLVVDNSSVLDGLIRIRTFLGQYGQSIKVPWNGQPTDLVDILITINKLESLIREFP